VEKTQDVEIHIFPGLHMDLVTDQLPTLAENLRTCLNSVQPAR
jgi:hypothetical protein